MAEEDAIEEDQREARGDSLTALRSAHLFTRNVAISGNITTSAVTTHIDTANGSAPMKMSFERDVCARASVECTTNTASPDGGVSSPTSVRDHGDHAGQDKPSISIGARLRGRREESQCDLRLG